jgi:phosphoribosylanthranilate isomerase
MVKVKICGITNVRDAKAALDAGADYLGLNFYKGSQRYIKPAAAKKIVQALKGRGAKIVGVFVNESPERVAEIARTVGLSHAQLHGEERPGQVAAIARAGVPVIKALRVGPDFRSQQLGEYPRAKALMLDGFDPDERGGTGKAFDWHQVSRTRVTKPLFLAGGITPENVAEAIRIAQPYAVDICSGVETAGSPRKKDKAKIAALMQTVRTAHRAQKPASHKSSRSKRK